EVGAALDEAGKAVGVLGLDVDEQAVSPVARVGLHQARLLVGLQAGTRGDYVRGFACPRQRAAPEDREWSSIGRPRGGALGEIRRPCPAGLVERNRQVALEAALQV